MWVSSLFSPRKGGTSTFLWAQNGGVWVGCKEFMLKRLIVVSELITDRLFLGGKFLIPLMLKAALRVGFWQNGFFCGFLFLGRRIFFADFVAVSFLWKNSPEKSSRKIPGKILQVYITTIPNIFLQRGRANVSATTACAFLSLMFFMRLRPYHFSTSTAKDPPLKSCDLKPHDCKTVLRMD